MGGRALRPHGKMAWLQRMADGGGLLGARAHHNCRWAGLKHGMRPPGEEHARSCCAQAGAGVDVAVREGCRGLDPPSASPGFAWYTRG